MPHIPSAPTAELSILPFADAMARSGQSGGYDAEKWLYVPDFYTEYRYLLGTRGEKPLVCIGINPSTAEPDRLDPTLQSVERVAKNNGYDSFLMFNVYAQRATRPNDMERVCNEALHRANMEAFDYILSLSEQRRVGGVGEHHRAARVSQGLSCRYDRHRRAARRAVVHGGAALGQGTPAPPALPQGDQPAGRVRHPRLLCRMPVGENAKNVRPLGERTFFYVPRGGHFLLAMSFTTSMTAPKSTPATAQMNQLYFGCPLPMGPKV